MAGALPPKACDNRNSMLESRDAGKTFASAGASEIPSMHCKAMQLERLISSGVCFGRLLPKEVNETKALHQKAMHGMSTTPSLPRWGHRSDWYRERLVDNISALTDRGARQNSWGPLEEHGELAQIRLSFLRVDKET